MILELFFHQRHHGTGARPARLARPLDAVPDAGEPEYAVASAAFIANPTRSATAPIDDETWYLEYDV